MPVKTLKFYGLTRLILQRKEQKISLTQVASKCNEQFVHLLLWVIILIINYYYVINDTSPKINAQEQTLPRYTKRTLAQLRANKCALLIEYLHKISPFTRHTPNTNVSTL